MPSPEQIHRWAVDWGTVKEVAGKKVDSIQFSAPSSNAGQDRLIIRFQDGTRLLVQAGPNGAIRAWLSCCGKPEGGPCEVRT